MVVTYDLSDSPICLSRVWLQTEMYDTKSSYQLKIKITIFEEGRITKWKKWKIRLTKEELTTELQLWMSLADLNYNFECHWLIELSDNNLGK